MSQQSDRCSDASLLALIEDNLPHQASEPILDHLEQCTHCQHRLGELVAPGDEWQRAAKLISSGHDYTISLQPVSTGKARRSSIQWTEAMAKQLLLPASHPELLGRLGRYDIEQLIGSGGMGVVFKAFDRELNRPVAIKALTPQLASSGPARKRFSREARAAAAVVHQHVVPIHNVETDRESPFIVMQLVSGESLQERLDREGPLELCEILRIGMQVADGLSAAHKQGLVHRDIKPGNILLEEGIDRALISDFGLARAADDASLSQTGIHTGTPQYMSPEQAQGESVDQKSDLFSLGTVLFALCTGKPPFRADSSYAVMRRIIDEKTPPIREINPDIPEWLVQIIDQLMAKDKNDRYESAQEVCALLASCLRHVRQPTHAQLPASLLTEQATGRPRWRRIPFLTSRRGVLTLLGLLMAGLFGISTLWLTEKIAHIQQPTPFDPPKEITQEARTQPAESSILKTDTPTTKPGPIPASLTGDLRLLQGDWIVQWTKENGEYVNETDQGMERHLLRFHGNTLTGIPPKLPPQQSAERVYRVEITSSTNPKAIDLINLEDPEDRLAGIYDIKNDCLHFCFTRPTVLNDFRKQKPDSDAESNPSEAFPERPTQFHSTAESNTILLRCRLDFGILDDLLLLEAESQLNSQQADELVELILDRQADQSQPWSKRMGDLIEKRWIRGELDRELWERYVLQRLTNMYQLQTRPRIVLGSSGGILIKLAMGNVRGGTGKHVSYFTEEKNKVLKIGTTSRPFSELAEPMYTGFTGTDDDYTTRTIKLNLGQPLWATIQPGKQNLSLEVDFHIRETPSPRLGEFESPNYETRKIRGLTTYVPRETTRKITFQTETTFLPAGQSTAYMNADPEWKSEVEQAVTLRHLVQIPTTSRFEQVRNQTQAQFHFGMRPIATAFRVILRHGKNEYEIGTVTLAAQKKTFPTISSIIGTELIGKRVDVILRPDLASAETSTDIFEIWGEEIVFRDVVVSHWREASHSK